LHRRQAVRRYHVPHPFAAEVAGSKRRCALVGEVTVVAEEVLAESVGDDLIHIDGDDGF
jgi:hypothetical protein